MSEFGNLSQCVLDADRGAIGRARRLRRKALLASLVLEAAAVVGLLLWPLVTPGVLPPATIVTPEVPFPRVRNSQPVHEHTNPNPAPRPPSNHPISFMPTTTIHTASTQTDPPPDIGVPGAPDREDRPVWIPSENVVAPPPPRSAKPPMISRGVMDALLVHRVQPEYPSLAKTIHLGGTVELRAIIGTDGSVRDLEVVSGNPILARAAVAAVWQWRYQPTRLSGTPVEVETQITVKFILE